MLLNNIVPFTHDLLRRSIGPGESVLDGTAGNGHDTLLLARCVGAEGKVWAFDVQRQALVQTAARLADAGIQAQVEYVCAGHETLAEYIGEPLAAAVFNFGWLPGGDKTLTTQADTSIRALNAALVLLKPGGLLAAVLYPGHEAGYSEANTVEAWAANLPQQQYAVLKYGFINQKNRPPYLLAIEKLQA